MRQEVYSGHLKFNGEEHFDTLREAYNYATALAKLNRFNESRALLLGVIPVARRTLGESKDTTLSMRGLYAQSLYVDPDATLDDLREAVATLADAERTARRVFGGAHPLTEQLQVDLRAARAELRARETPSPSA